MTLRRRLVLLHSAFAAFAVFAALAIIYGIQVYTEQAAERVGALVSEIRLAEELLVELRVLDVHLHEVVSGRRPADAAFDVQHQAVLARLEDVARFACRRELANDVVCTNLQELRGQLTDDLELCLDHVREGDLPAATELFKTRIEARLDEVEGRLHRLRGLLDMQGSGDRSRLFARHAQLLWLSLLVAAGGVGLVLAGAMVVRRRLVTPIARLKEATEALGRGDLTHRVQLDTVDELGRLAESFNSMAASLRTSQLKFRSLFENQRDTVIVCDRNGLVRECHEGDTRVLAAGDGPTVGRRLADLWPDGAPAAEFWTPLVKAVFARQETIRVNERAIRVADTPRYVDVVAYPVDYADQPYAAIVLRDAEERRRLQQELRRSEQMSAAITMARGVAHDFKNLLHSAVNTLAAMESDDPAGASAPRIRSALAACRQAASLAKRLTRFATTDRGLPEQVALAEILPVIMESLDDSFRAGLQLEVDCDPAARVTIDRDHLTQIMLNLLVNAREAMPEGGRLRVRAARSALCEAGGRRTEGPCAVIAVQDSGCGIAPEDRDRIFQPFFSSKERAEHGPRGLGLAVVYALVTNAGGFVQVDSAPGAGSTFRVFLPQAAGG